MVAGEGAARFDVNAGARFLAAFVGLVWPQGEIVAAFDRQIHAQRSRRFRRAHPFAAAAVPVPSPIRTPSLFEFFFLGLRRQFLLLVLAILAPHQLCPRRPWPSDLSAAPLRTVRGGPGAPGRVGPLLSPGLHRRGEHARHGGVIC